MPADWKPIRFQAGFDDIDRKDTAMRLTIRISVPTTRREVLLGVRQVVIDRLRGAGITPDILSATIVDMTASESALVDDSSTEWYGPRSCDTPAVPYGPGVGLTNRTKILLRLFDHDQAGTPRVVTAPGAGFLEYSRQMADLLEEWSGDEGRM